MQAYCSEQFLIKEGLKLKIKLKIKKLRNRQNLANIIPSLDLKVLFSAEKKIEGGKSNENLNDRGV